MPPTLLGTEERQELFRKLSLTSKIDPNVALDQYSVDLKEKFMKKCDELKLDRSAVEIYA